MADETTGLTIGIPREADENERRVAIVPATVPALQKLGLRVTIEAGAGVAAGFPDEMYSQRNAEVLDSREAIFQQADIILINVILARLSGQS